MGVTLAYDICDPGDLAIKDQLRVALKSDICFSRPINPLMDLAAVEDIACCVVIAAEAQCYGGVM